MQVGERPPLQGWWRAGLCEAVGSVRCTQGSIHAKRLTSPLTVTMCLGRAREEHFRGNPAQLSQATGPVERVRRPRNQDWGRGSNQASQEREVAVPAEERGMHASVSWTGWLPGSSSPTSSVGVKGAELGQRVHVLVGFDSRENTAQAT